jgi:hypothetical protein
MKLTYEAVKAKEEVLKAMPSLTPSEFEKLTVYFEEALHVKLRLRILAKEEDPLPSNNRRPAFFHLVLF